MVYWNFASSWAVYIRGYYVEHSVESFNKDLTWSSWIPSWYSGTVLETLILLHKLILFHLSWLHSEVERHHGNYVVGFPRAVLVGDQGYCCCLHLCDLCLLVIHVQRPWRWLQWSLTCWKFWWIWGCHRGEGQFSNLNFWFCFNLNVLHEYLFWCQSVFLKFVTLIWLLLHIGSCFLFYYKDRVISVVWTDFHEFLFFIFYYYFFFQMKF